MVSAVPALVAPSQICKPICLTNVASKELLETGAKVRLVAWSVPVLAELSCHGPFDAPLDQLQLDPALAYTEPQPHPHPEVEGDCKLTVIVVPVRSVSEAKL